MEAGRPRLIPGTALRSIDDPAHCLSRLVCGAGGPKIPPAVLAFQNRMRERQRILDGEELKCKLARAADERSLLEDKVCEQQQRKRKLAGDVDSDGSSTDNSPTASPSKCASLPGIEQYHAIPHHVVPIVEARPMSGCAKDLDTTTVSYPYTN